MQKRAHDEAFGRSPADALTCDEELVLESPPIVAVRGPETPDLASEQAHSALKEAARALPELAFKPAEIQPFVAERDFCRMLDRMFGSVARLGFEQHVFFLAAQLLTRYVGATKAVTLGQLRAYAAASLLVAAKVEEVSRVEPRDVINVFNGCTFAEALATERSLLHTLDWSVHKPTVYLFLPAYDGACSAEVQESASYLAYVSCFSGELCTVSPDKLAAACMFAAVAAHGAVWTKRLGEVAECEAAALKPLGCRVLETCAKIYDYRRLCPEFWEQFHAVHAGLHARVKARLA